MSRRNTNSRRPQARKTYTRLGARKVTRGIDTGTYNGGYQSRTETVVSDGNV